MFAQGLQSADSEEHFIHFEIFMVCIAGWKTLFYDVEVLEVVHGYLHIKITSSSSD